MIVLFILGTSSLLVTGLEAKKDIWIAILLAIASSALIMLIYSRLVSVLPGKDFIEMVEYFFGKIGTKVILLMLTWFAFHNCALVLRNYGQFVVTVGLPETPLVAAMFILIVVCAMTVRQGIEVMGRWSETFILYVLVFLIISVLLVSPNLNISHLLPVFDNGFVPIAKGTLGVIAFPFAQTVVFLLVFPAFKNSGAAKKVFLRGLLIGGTFILVTSLIDMLVLGETIAENMYYPTYMTMATVHFGDFLQRFEVIAAIVFILGVFVKVSVLLLGASRGTARLLGIKNYRPIVVPIALLVVVYAVFSFDSMIYYHEWILAAYPYYAVVFEILIPLVLFIIIEAKIRRSKKETADPRRKKSRRRANA